MSQSYKLSVLAAAATILCGSVPASAADGQGRLLSTTAKISLTIESSVVLRMGTNQRGAPQLTATANGGLTLDDVGVSYTVRDSRGEREFNTARTLQAALADAQRRGEREIDVTIVF